MCEKVWSTKENEQSHAIQMHESVTSKKELNCASCQERLETKENLQNHISEMHKGAFTCMTCEKNLFYKDCFRLHMYEAQCSHGNKLMKTMLKNKEVKEETSRIIWLIQIKWLRKLLKIFRRSKQKVEKKNDSVLKKDWTQVIPMQNKNAPNVIKKWILWQQLTTTEKKTIKIFSNANIVLNFGK